MVRKIVALFVLIWVLPFLGAAQDVLITKYIEGSGGMRKDHFSFCLNPKKTRLKLTEYRTIETWRHHDSDDIDSVNIKRFRGFAKSYDNYVFSRMLDYILSNNQPKIIGLNPQYFLDSSYLKTHADSIVQDTMNQIDLEIRSNVPSNVHSSAYDFTIVNLTYKEERYVFSKRSYHLYWCVYKDSEEELLFRFFYPDWNIMVYNMIKMKPTYKSDLRFVNFDAFRDYDPITKEYYGYDLGTKILTPVTPKRKRSN